MSAPPSMPRTPSTARPRPLFGFARAAYVLLALLLLALGTAPAATAQQLTAALVGQVIAQAVQEAQARGKPATVAVVDRVGNVLGVFRMTGAAGTVTITSGRGVSGGLEGASVPDTAAAIAKAITGAYLSSNGNAFTTRTASQIIQEHFNPGERFQPSGPLFGVQFSQLPCSDLSVRFATNAGGTVNATIGPKRSPLGLAGDPGGLPLYVNGVLAGGIGVTAKGLYGLDLNIFDVDADVDELLALAGTAGFDAPTDIRANRVSVNGRSLRYTDQDTGALAANPGAAAPFGSINGSAGSLVGVNGYYDATGGLRDGTIFGTAASGIRADGGTDFSDARANVLVDGANANRYSPRAGTDGPNALTASEVRAILSQALGVSLSARAQIRRPLDSAAQVTISVVDTNGMALGVVRTPDAPVFGIDVSLQKARTAAFFSGSNAGTELSAAGLGSYVKAAQNFLGPSALTGFFAFTDRANGNLSRPFYPDGIDGKSNGPFSRPFNQWSPFTDGLQLDLVLTANLVQHLGFVANGANPDTPAYCTALPLVAMLGAPRIANGIQIFPGSVPVFRAGTLIGGVGVSGDGVDQDDMVSFLGLDRAASQLGTGIGNAPPSRRADNLTPQGARLRYVSCPFQPFLDQSNQNACQGK